MDEDVRTPPDDDAERARFSRRQVLAAAGAGVLGGAAVGVAGGYILDDGDPEGVAAPAEPAAAPATTAETAASSAEELGATTHHEEAEAGGESRPLVSLSALEGTALAAMLARLIPSDDAGPGADEAMTWRFIDRGLTGPLAETRPIYQAGLAALDEVARADGAESFADLDAGQQDAILERIEKGEAEGGFAPDPATFFATVREHALQGTFGDPLHGGNAGGVGWALLGYPGYRAVIAPEEQAYDATLQPGSGSTYDDAMYGLAPVKEA